MSLDIRRRDFLRSASGFGVTLGLLDNSEPSLGSVVVDPCVEATFPQIQNLTSYVSQFVVDTKLSDIPLEVLELGKKSILDGLGLALSGSKAETAGLVQKYVNAFGFPQSGASVLGSAAKLPPRFAAFAISAPLFNWTVAGTVGGRRKCCQGDQRGLPGPSGEHDGSACLGLSLVSGFGKAPPARRPGPELAIDGTGAGAAGNPYFQKYGLLQQHPPRCLTLGWLSAAAHPWTLSPRITRAPAQFPAPPASRPIAGTRRRAGATSSVADAWPPNGPALSAHRVLRTRSDGSIAPVPRGELPAGYAHGNGRG